LLTHTCSFRSQPLSNSLSTPAVVCDAFVCDSSARRRGQKSYMISLPHPASTHVGKSESDVSIARDKRGLGSTSVLVAPTIEGRIDRAPALAPAKPRRQPVYCDIQGSRAFFATGVWGTAHQPVAAQTWHKYTACPCSMRQRGHLVHKSR